MIPIDQGIPHPDYNFKTRRGPKEKYPFDYLRVGDSFHAPIGSTYSVAVQASTRNRGGEKSFVTKNTDTGIRVWRVK